MLGLQTALSVIIETMVTTGRLDWAGVAERLSIAPARIGRASRHGQSISPGSVANLVLVDPTQTWIVDGTELASKSRNTPYAGMSLPGRVVHVVKDGRPTVVDARVVLDGAVAGSRS